MESFFPPIKKPGTGGNCSSQYSYPHSMESIECGIL